MANTEYRYSGDTLLESQKYLYAVLLKMLKSDKKLTVLDMGCGNGSFTHLISLMGHEVVGVDSSSSGIGIASRKHPDIRFICRDIYTLEGLGLYGGFDIVVACDVIEHLSRPRELVNQAKNCLKNDESRLIISTPYHGYLKNLMISLVNGWDKHFSVLWDAGHIKFFSRDTLSALLCEEGFRDIDFTFTGRLPYLWKSMICSAALSLNK